MSFNFFVVDFHKKPIDHSDAQIFQYLGCIPETAGNNYGFQVRRYGLNIENGPTCMLFRLNGTLPKIDYTPAVFLNVVIPDLDGEVKTRQFEMMFQLLIEHLVEQGITMKTGVGDNILHYEGRMMMVKFAEDPSMPLTDYLVETDRSTFTLVNTEKEDKDHPSDSTPT